MSAGKNIGTSGDLKVPYQGIGIQPMSQSPSASRFRIYPTILGRGQFGEVSLGLSLNNRALVAIKRETKGKWLRHECKIIDHMSRNHQGSIPGIEIYGQWNSPDGYCMAMPLHGPSLDYILSTVPDRRFNMTTCLTIGIQLIEAIEACHLRGVVHCDIKPANILTNFSWPADRIHLVDFGLAQRYTDAHGNHIPYATGCARAGTIRYCSKSTHRSIQSSCRDDIATIGYVLMFLSLGKLPWQGLTGKMTLLQKHEKTLEIKTRFGPHKLTHTIDTECRNGSPEAAAIRCTSDRCQFVDCMSNYLTYADSLEFGQSIDYQRLTNGFRECLKAHNLSEGLSLPARA